MAQRRPLASVALQENEEKKAPTVTKDKSENADETLFEFDRVAMMDYHRRSFLCTLCPLTCCMWGCCEKVSALEKATSQHLFLQHVPGKRSVLYYNRKETRQGCRCPDEQDVVPALRVTLPVEHVTGVSIKGPKGGCCVRDTLSTVEVHTSGWSAMKLTSMLFEPTKIVREDPLSIYGLRDPEGFRDALMDAKARVNRTPLGDLSTHTLLTEIREEMRGIKAALEEPKMQR